MDWLRDSQRIEEVAPDVQTALLATQDVSSFREKRFALELLLKWGDEKSCAAIGKGLVERQIDLRKGVEFLEKHDTQESSSALAFVLRDYRLGEKVHQVLQDRKKTAEAAVLTYINSTDGNYRTRSRKLIDFYKTDPGLVASQCVKDLDSTEDAIVHFSLEYLSTFSIESENTSAILKKLDSILTKGLGGDNHRLTELAALAFCRWATENEKSTIDILVGNTNHKIYTAAIICQLRLDKQNGQRNLKRMFADGGKRRQIVEAMGKLDGEYEVHVTPLMSTDKEDEVRGAIEILRKIGTAKSIRLISRVGRRAKSMNRSRISNEAEAAIQAIRAREKNKGM